MPKHWPPSAPKKHNLVKRHSTLGPRRIQARHTRIIQQEILKYIVSRFIVAWLQKNPGSLSIIVMKLRVLSLQISLSLLLAIVYPAAAQDLPLPEQIKQWMQQCEKGYEQGQYAKVLPICQRVVAVLQPLLPNHPVFAASLNRLAELYDAQGNSAKAEPFHLWCLRIREKVLGPEHPDVGESLSNLALTYIAQGKYLDAEPLILRSLTIDQKVYGPEHPDVATDLSILAELYRTEGSYAKAEPLYLHGLRIREKAFGPEHLKVAGSLNSLAMLYKEQGNSPKAEPLYLRSLRIRERELGPEHPQVATSLNNLASLYKEQGNFPKAEPLFLRSLAIDEKVYGPDHIEVADVLNNLAGLYESQGEYSKAEPMYLRSLQIREQKLGPEHPYVAHSLSNLAGIYMVQGSAAKAEALYGRSLRIVEKSLGSEHRHVGTVLNNLAWFYYTQGNLRKAEPLYLRSLRIVEKSLGLEHPDVATSLNNLTAVDMARGQPAQALPLFARALGIRERALRAVTTEARITSTLDKMRGEEDAVYSLLLRKDAPAEALALALRVALLRKGRAAEAGLMTAWALQASLTSEDQRQRFDRWQLIRSQYESLLLHGPAKSDDATREAHQARLTMLNNQRDDMEHELALAAPQLTQWKLPEPEQILNQVAVRLPAGSVLVEVLWVKPFQFQATNLKKSQGTARYMTLVLFPDQRIEFVDLGDAEEMDRAAGELLVAMRDLSQEPLSQAHALYQKIIAPLLTKLAGVQRIYLSLDGSLNLIPFAALHDGKQYLLDAPYQFLYLGSGRDLLRRALGQPQQPAVVMADPDFGGPLTATAQSDSRTMDDDTRGLYDGLASLAPLKGARAEGIYVGGLLHVSPLLDAAATEARLRQVRSPFILHVATHGLFLRSELAESRGTRATMVGVRPNDTFNQMTGRTGDRSLSRSALVLAGAAHAAEAPGAANDGLLTAEEARSLSLFGTQLVVLSACDTGLGTVKAGQGVYGLRRAFLAAGAQTVVMSLWPISDTGTQGLMQRYYRLLLDDKTPRTRIGGLLEAMKAEKAEHRHPYYWAPFIANGLDAPLQFSPSDRPL